MSQWRTTRNRNEGIRELNRWRLSKSHEVVDGGPDYSRPVYRLRAAGYEAVLAVFKPERSEGAFRDFDKFMEAVRAVVTNPVKERG